MIDRETLHAAFGDPPQVPQEARAHARALLVRRIAETQPGASRAPARRARRGRWLAAAAVAFAASAAAIVVPLLSTSFSTPTAADALERVADTAARGFGALGPLPSNGYWYTRARIQAVRPASGTSRGLLVRSGDVEQWRARSGAVRYRATGHITLLSPSLRGGFSSPFGALTYSEVQALPANPVALLARIEASARALRASLSGRSGRPAQDRLAEPMAGTEIAVLADVLNDLPLKADVRAALFRAAARIPHVRVIPSITDPTGRRGMAIVVPTITRIGNVTLAADRELVVDPTTSALLANETVATTPSAALGLARGAILASTVFVASGIVSSDTAWLRETP